jgi:murein DD-endopeptidase MepM/ murein hydrolase activator NlpD
MEIIVLLRSKKIRLNLSLGVITCSAICIILATLTLGIFYSGIQYATSRSSIILQSLSVDVSGQWQRELKNQEKIVKNVKSKAEKSLDAIASRMSVLQGHVMRLDALGARLAQMADIQDIEFGIDHPPGMGGPEKSLDQQSIDVANILDTLKDLELTIEDRKEKLIAVESMLINRTLQEQIVPEGHPATNGWISSLFGIRTDPINGKKEMHEGLDFAGKPGTTVSSIAAGIVTWSGPRFGYGNMIEISHGNGYITRYAHNKKNLVSVGDKVEKGEVIAVMGNTGRSTGTHVHIEVMHNGILVDPKKYIVFN